MSATRLAPALALAAALAAGRADAQEPPSPEEPAGEPANAARETLLAEVEVVATGFPRHRGDATAPVTVVDGSWYEERGVASVAEGLRQVPGVSVSRGGTPGAPVSLFVRGAASNQVLVLQDGIPLNDPTVGSQFNFFDLDALNLSRVEVLRGSYGAVYGSSAVGGVVNLVSRRGEGPGTFRISAEGGSFLSHREVLTGEGGDADADWSFGLAESGTDGPGDRQAFRSRSFSGLFGARAAGDGRLEVAVRWLDSTAEDPYDFGNPLVEDDNIRRERETAAAGASFEKPVAEWLTARARISVADIDSAFRNGSDAGPGGPPELESATEATTTSAGLSARATLHEDEARAILLEAVGGADWKEEESLGSTDSPFGSGIGLDATTRNTGAWLLATAEIAHLTLTGGGRYDRHTQAGGEWSPQAGALYDLQATWTVLRANYGEGFRAPTPAESTDPWVGNPGLGPERSLSLDAGIDQEFFPGVTLQATWFRLRTEDLIAYDASTLRLENVDRAKVEGTEVGLLLDAGKYFLLRASWTRQRARDESTGERLPHRPDQFASAGIEWRRGDWSAAADLYWQGSVEDLGLRGPDQDLRDHPGRRFVVGLSGRWRATERLSLLARVENLLDGEYVETPASPKGLPLSAFLGASWDF